jgi:dCTP deaminase
MRLLVDRDIITALQQPQPIASGLPLPLNVLPTRTSQVQAASLNFTIGDIFIPGTNANELGGLNCPLSDYELRQGHTAVIRTRETIRLSAFRAGIGFPPAFQSLKGLLMTNPGHIDPGYNGPLHCNVINMAHQSFHLERGDPIMRILVFEMASGDSPTDPYYSRAHLTSDQIGPSPITAELLDRLSVDFVDVEKRSVEAAERQINKTQIRANWIPVLAAIAAGLLGFGATYFTSTLSVKDDVAKLREQFIEAKSGLQNTDAVVRLQDEVTALKEELTKYEATNHPTPQPNAKQ